MHLWWNIFRRRTIVGKKWIISEIHEQPDKIFFLRLNICWPRKDYVSNVKYKLLAKATCCSCFLKLQIGYVCKISSFSGELFLEAAVCTCFSRSVFSCNFIKKRPRYKRFPVNIEKFLNRTLPVAASVSSQIAVS